MRFRFIVFKKIFLEKILAGDKVSTIRLNDDFQVGGVYPVKCRWNDPLHCFIKIVSREKKRLKDLTDGDARLDGFSSVLELKEALRKCYKNISDETEVFIYHFKLLKTLEKIRPILCYFQISLFL